MQDQKVAVVAMSGVFPQADSVDELWANIMLGREAGVEFSVDELEATGFLRSVVERPDFVRRRPVLNRCDLFDAEFFGFSDIEAEALDPQLRLLLQCAYHSLEEAGALDRGSRLRTGVFLGMRQSRYLDEHLMGSPRHGRSLGYDYLQMINRKDSAATLLSYKLDLGGPSISVNTACSTSLLAVHLACNNLLSYECDFALAGGAAISSFGPDGIAHVPGGILSKDGRCRPFSADADGTIDGSGVAVVGLKRLEDALRDGNRVHAVILGSAANNDGADKVGYTAPSVGGQARVIAEALALSGISPDSMGYVEAHGTGTRLGDPIEVRALTQVYRRFTERRGYCHLGSIKANVGHLGSAAGVTGLIKAALVVRNGLIPPLVNFSSANPDLALASSPFKVSTEGVEWPAQAEPRRAAVSSFGIGGTNVHAILEEPPGMHASAQPAANTARFELCVLSTKSPVALASTAKSIARHLASSEKEPLDEVAATLADSRSHMPWRRFEVVDSLHGLAEKFATSPEPLAEPPRARRRVAFLFPGQGSQHSGMGMGLYARWQPFRQAFDEISALVKHHSGIDLLAQIQSGDDNTLKQTSLAQPALFATSLAMARAWRALGLEPNELLGHSVGEIAAACVAGVFSLEDAVRLVCARGRLMQAAPPGAMLAVSLDPTTLASHLMEGVELAVVNGRTSCVVAGPSNQVERLREALAAQGVAVRPLHTSHAFHSAAMAGAARELAEVAGQLRLSPPTLPIVSSVTGHLMTDDQACSPAYWAQAVRAPVQFLGGLQTLLARQVDVALEVGPGNTLSSLVKTEQTPCRAVASMPHPSVASKQSREDADQKTFLRAAGELWSLGLPIDLGALVHKREGYRRAALPGYAFDTKRYWVDARPGAYQGGMAHQASSSQADQGVAWRRAALTPIVPTAITDTASNPDLAVRDSRLPIEEALLAALAQADAAPPCVLADFDQPANRQALARMAGRARIDRDIVLLDGRAFALTLENSRLQPASHTLNRLAGIPSAWHAPLREHMAAGASSVASSTPLNLVRLAGPADAVPTDLQQVEAGVGAWLLVDEPDLPSAQRLRRLALARDTLDAAGVSHTTWLALDGPSPCTTARDLCELLDSLVALDGAAYTARLRSPVAALSPEDLSKGHAMSDATNAPGAPADNPSDVRAIIQSIWRSVLDRPDVGLDDNFFDLGGNSLWALQIVSQVNTAFGCELHLSELLNSATVGELAALVEKRLLSAVDDDELSALLNELGDASEEDIQQMLAEMTDATPRDASTVQA